MTETADTSGASPDVVSDDQLREKQQAVQALREEVAAAEAQRVQTAREQANTIAMAELDAEEARLNAQLAAARQQLENPPDTTSGPLAVAEETREAAEAQVEGVEAKATADAEQQQLAEADEPPPARSTEDPPPELTATDTETPDGGTPDGGTPDTGTADTPAPPTPNANG